jgi:hypothetical protein
MNVITLPIQRRPQPSQPLVSLEAPSSSPSLPSQSPALSPQSLSSPAPGPRLPAPLLVGRDSELTHLHRLLDKSLNGERQTMFVSGEAGIGKTTLIDAFLAQIRDRVDVRITSGQCVEQYGPGEAYMPLLEATQRLCRGPGGERYVAGLQRYAPSWLAQLPSLLEPQDFDRLQQRAQGTSRERMLREMAEAAEMFTTRRGLVMVLEDLHWSDVSTLDWITYIARRREPAKLLIEEWCRSYKRDGNVTRCGSRRWQRKRLRNILPNGSSSGRNMLHPSEIWRHYLPAAQEAVRYLSSIPSTTSCDKEQSHRKQGDGLCKQTKSTKLAKAYQTPYGS